MDNPQMELALEFINHTSDHIFLTGKAGTGKTTFLRKLGGLTSKRMVVVAPTGVAALNASGVTIHSLFQLPFGAITPAMIAPGNMRVSKEKIEIMQNLDLLVIDEISMVRADVMDAIDVLLRRHRNSSTPFGGVQLLMIGDMQQLSPVVTNADMDTLSGLYKSFYFFDSYALSSTSMRTVCLTTIFRQQDSDFIELLEAVRSGQITEQVQQRLNSRYIPDFKPPVGVNYITLTSHRDKAEVINTAKMAEIQKPAIEFEAKVWGDFPESLYPNDATLKLKLGAQVMFTRNDVGKDKLFYNGKIGIITSINSKGIKVTCRNSSGGSGTGHESEQEISVPMVEWKNIKYTLNKDTGHIDEQTVGTFTQYPLRSAWAITIHKSQGLTFTHAVIDAQSSFSHGQVYVALSRCTSLQGLVLSSPIRSGSIVHDPLITDFDTHAHNNQPSKMELEQAKNLYFEQLVCEVFDFSEVERLFSNLAYYYTSQLGQGITVVATYPTPQTLTQVKDQIHSQITEVGQKMVARITGNLKREELIELLNRAAGYYQLKIGEIVIPTLHIMRSVKANTKPINKAYRTKLDALQSKVDVKIEFVNYLNSCSDFDTDTYHRIKTQVLAKSGSMTAATTPTDAHATHTAVATPEYIKHGTLQGPAQHPELYRALIAWRRNAAVTQQTLPFKVATIPMILAMSQSPCTTLAELAALQELSPEFIEQYGDQIMAVYDSYKG